MTNIIKILNSSFKINKEKLFNLINNVNIVKEAVNDPRSNLFSDTFLFNILLVPNRSKKSKKKFIIRHRSIYIFMISPLLIYK